MKDDQNREKLKNHHKDSYIRLIMVFWGLFILYNYWYTRMGACIDIIDLLHDFVLIFFHEMACIIIY